MSDPDLMKTFDIQYVIEAEQMSREMIDQIRYGGGWAATNIRNNVNKLLYDNKNKIGGCYQLNYTPFIPE
jgi:hypothetical protein